MGGGGGVFHSRTPDDYKREIREIRDKTKDEAFETDVNEKINENLGLIIPEIQKPTVSI